MDFHCVKTTKRHSPQCGQAAAVSPPVESSSHHTSLIGRDTNYPPPVAVVSCGVR